jgi:hypothetical protein
MYSRNAILASLFNGIGLGGWVTAGHSYDLYLIGTLGTITFKWRWAGMVRVLLTASVSIGDVDGYQGPLRSPGQDARQRQVLQCSKR